MQGISIPGELAQHHGLQQDELIDTVEIPLRGRPTRFRVSLRDVTYSIRLYWLVPSKHWVIDIANGDNVPIANGVPLITGTDLLSQFAYLNFGGQLLVISDHMPPDADPPDWNSLNDTGHLIYIPDKPPPGFDISNVPGQG